MNKICYLSKTIQNNNFVNGQKSSKLTIDTSRNLWYSKNKCCDIDNFISRPCDGMEDKTDSKSVVERRAGSNPVGGSYPITSTFTWWIT